MSNGGYLVPPDETAKGTSSEIWEETWKRVDRFLPNLFAEIFPPPPPTAPPLEQQQRQKQQVVISPPEGSVAPAAAATVLPTMTPTEKTKDAKAAD